MSDDVVPFANVTDQLVAIVDIGRLLAARLAFLQASIRGDMDPLGQTRTHELAREVARYLGGAGTRDEVRDRARQLAITVDAAFGAFVQRLGASVAQGTEMPI